MPTTRPLGQQAIEVWLQRCLRQQHAAVLQEPVPETLLALLRQHEPA